MEAQAMVVDPDGHGSVTLIAPDFYPSGVDHSFTLFSRPSSLTVAPRRRLCYTPRGNRSNDSKLDIGLAVTLKSIKQAITKVLLSDEHSDGSTTLLVLSAQNHLTGLQLRADGGARITSLISSDEPG
jgi:hypothetical protein